MNVTKNPDQVVHGAEPVWTEKVKPNFTSALNWYAYFKDHSDSKKYLIAHLKATKTPPSDLAAIGALPEDDFKNIGFVARMVDRGLVDKNAKQHITKHVEMLLSKVKKNKKTAKKTGESVINVKKPNVQDYIKAQASLAIGEIEGAIDDCDFSAEKLDVILEDFKIKGPQSKHIVTFFDKRKAFVEECMWSADPDLAQAYAHLHPKDLTAYVEYLDLIRIKCNQVALNAKAGRKPRKKKAKAASSVVAKIKYLKEDRKLKLVSVNPEGLVGAKQLYVFNVKTRRLGVYNSDFGLSMKGTTLQGFDEKTSVQKTVRKPETKLPELLAAGKVALRTIIKDIKAVASPLTGRINKDVLLLRVIS